MRCSARSVRFTVFVRGTIASSLRHAVCGTWVGASQVSIGSQRAVRDSLDPWLGIPIGEIIAIVGKVVVLGWKLFSRTRPQISPAKQWGQASSDRFRYEELFE